MSAPQTKSPDASPNPAAAGLLFIVDDEAMLLELATLILGPLGYEIRTFREPGVALRAFREANPHPDLVITDYAMHQMNGESLMFACRQIEPNQKFLMLSGTVDRDFCEHLSTKPDGFLEKPYRAKQLVTKVKSMLAI